MQNISTEEKIVEMIKSDSVISKHFNGFKLYNLTTDKNIISHNEELLFTPASNIKLLTYLTCLNILEDSLTTFKYKVINDTLAIVPQGDPSFLNDKIDTNQHAFEFLRSQNKIVQIIKKPEHDINAFGSGWAWEDAQYSYQSPLSFFPMYGNRVTFSPSSDIYNINVKPSYFKSQTITLDTFETFIMRNEYENIFYINDRMIPKNYEIERPFITSKKLTIDLLNDTLVQSVGVIVKNYNDDDTWHSFKNLPSDTLYKKVLFESDNHVADQLLLMCSETKLGYMNTEDIVNYSIDSILNVKQKDLRWVDGSGLSRYNLVSPKVFNLILRKIYQRVGLNKIKELFPTGRTGDTLPSIFNNEKDWIYAKTGTLSNNFSISGYLITDNNQLMAFSFMNNHYTSSKKSVSDAMYEILKTVKTLY